MAASASANMLLYDDFIPSFCAVFKHNVPPLMVPTHSELGVKQSFIEIFPDGIFSNLNTGTNLPNNPYFCAKSESFYD
jgi:hypothetical protein